MIASCYRRMNLFNEALKIYLDIEANHGDNIDCLRGIVTIKKELGMPYQQYSEKLMALDREEEARKMMMGAGENYGQTAGYADPSAYNAYDLS